MEKDRTNGDLAACDGGPLVFVFDDSATTVIYTLSLHDALPISNCASFTAQVGVDDDVPSYLGSEVGRATYGLQSYNDLVFRLRHDQEKAVSVDITGVTNLRLVTTDYNGNNNYDHSDWGDAKVVW